MAVMPYVVNSILKTSAGAFIPLTGKIAVIANLIDVKTDAVSCAALKLTDITSLRKTEWDETVAICKRIDLKLRCGGACLWCYCITLESFL